MFAAALALAAKLAPVAVRVATHPNTIRFAVGTAAVSGANIALRTSRLQGEDKVGQRQAEAIQATIDPSGFAEDPRRISSLRQRVGRNTVLLGSAVATEGRAFRSMVAPPVYGVRYLQVVSAARGIAKAGKALQEVRAGNNDLAPTPDMVKAAERCEKAGNRYFQRTLQLEKARGWFKINRGTPGEMYLADQIHALILLAQSNEVRADSVEQVYIRLLEENITSLDITNPHEAGMAAYVAVTNSFRGDEIGLIRSRVLKAWLVKTHSVSNDAWRKFTQGWDAASRVAQTV